MTALRMTVDKNGEKRWCNQAGRAHRLDGPAIERPDGFKAWYQNGLLHRLDGPAMEWPNGDKEWFQNGADWPEGEAIYLTTEITYVFYPCNYLPMSFNGS